jgi:mono/diheme cytochrome c family protein
MYGALGGRMKTVLKIVGVLVAVVLVVAGGFYAWAAMTTSRLAARTFETHTADFPIPFPLDPSEVSALGLVGDQADAAARARAIERGEHLLGARYPCRACHGQNFGGGIMVDDAMLGHFLAPNLTLGKGSRTASFTAHDWDRIVRHGVKSDGHGAVMPSEDFKNMSDQELSDIVTYIRAQPPVDNQVPASTFGPVGTVLIAMGQLSYAANTLAANTTHPVRPPAEAASAEFGKHLAGVCTGCHGPDLSGGKILGGDPSWPPARNLTPDATGLKGWTYEQFVAAITEAKRPDGTAVRAPMGTLVPLFTKNMRDVERQALWAYVQSIPPVSKKIDAQ